MIQYKTIKPGFTIATPDKDNEFEINIVGRDDQDAWMYINMEQAKELVSFINAHIIKNEEINE